MKYYAIAEGFETDVIVESWEECRDLVEGHKGARFKSFKTKEEAQEWLNEELGPPWDDSEQLDDSEIDFVISQLKDIKEIIKTGHSGQAIAKILSTMGTLKAMKE